MNRHSVRRVLIALMVALIGSGGAPSPRAEAAKAGPPPYDPATLSEIADDVLRRASPTAKPPEPIAIAPSAAATVEDFDGVEFDPPPDSPITDIAPAREGIAVPIPREAALAGQGKSQGVSKGYRSNSSRQGDKKTPKGLTFSTGALAPASGLDAALQTQALAIQDRPFVYGFVLLRGRPDEALERQLAGFGVELLGPHDDHHKARLPVGSLAALAAMPEVAWLGVSPPDLKLDGDLAALRGPKAEKAGFGPATPIPVVINLFEGDETGTFRRELEALGATIAKYDPELEAYRAVATVPVIERIAALDFVLFVELIGKNSVGHDQSMPLIDIDAIRPGTPLGHTRFSAATVLAGVIDSGFEMGGGRHVDLNKFGCGIDYTAEQNPFYDGYGAGGTGHGTHVLATIAGTGTANPTLRGAATGLGAIDRIRVAKIWAADGQGQDSWWEDAMDFMSQSAACGSAPPEVINVSGGKHGTNLPGTDALSRKQDGKVWTYGQAYVVCAGNEGPLSASIRSPGVAKNALTVGMVYDWGYQQVGDYSGSSQGPTGDGRMKPNVVAPGAYVTSARAGTTNEYFEQGGCSMATPHVTGLVATLMDHYPDFRGRPALLRAHMMATAIAHDDMPGGSDSYGLGRVSGYTAHWDSTNSAGWHTYKFWGGVNSQGYQYNDITVPPNTKRLIVVLTWDEPAASAGASRAVTYDLDLWVDHEASCPFQWGDCGEYQSVSFVDNVEYIIIENPPAGLYRMKAHPYNAPSFHLPYGMVARIIRGDPTPAMMASLNAPPSNPKVGESFTLTLQLSTPAYVVSGAHVENLDGTPAGLTFQGFKTTRHDGTTVTSLGAETRYTLGNLVPMLGRSATWTYRADSPGPKNFRVRVWSENGGEVLLTKAVQVVTPQANLAETEVTTTPGYPVRAPGSALSITDTVHNIGEFEARSSTTRYYLSLDGVKNAGDLLLGGSRAVPALAVAGAHTGTANVTISAATPLNNYIVLACADDLRVIAEGDESNNCAAAPGVVIVTRPDVLASAVSNPPATAKRGARFPVTDTTSNVGILPADPSKTRYYLSLDGVKSADDRVLAVVRSVPTLAPNTSHAGTVTVTIPTATVPNAYFLLACADGTSAVTETSESNNCVASATTVAVTP